MLDFKSKCIIHNVFGTILGALKEFGLEKTLEDMRSVCKNAKNYNRREHFLYANACQEIDDMKEKFPEEKRTINPFDEEGGMI